MAADTLRKAIAGIILLGAAGVVYFEYQNTRPCVHPIAYSLGVIDPRFGESTADLLTDTTNAITMWNRAAGKTLFVYDPKGALKVNLIYDNRQKTAQLGNTIKQTQAGYAAEKAAIDALEAAYEANLAKYNQQVDYWNAHGGAPAAAYPDLQAQKAALNQKLADLKVQIAAFNAKTRQTNQTIDTYNAGVSAQVEAGEYVRDSSGTRIDVYEYSSKTQLVRLLAHEFGHSLGLDHNQNPVSIMYPVNNGKTLSLSADDLTALKALCKISS